MNILVLNVGSSSVKFQLLELEPSAAFHSPTTVLAKGIVDEIGRDAKVTLVEAEKPKQKSTENLPDSAAALGFIATWLKSLGRDRGAAGLFIDAVGHRVVHGGEHFREAVLIDDQVIAAIEECSDLAPLHNPPAVAAIRVARTVLGAAIPQVAVFDTAFHQTLPQHSYLYAIPYELYQKHKLRKYGFHGTSHRYLKNHYASIKGIAITEVNAITLHLGNGCSIAAIRGGKSIDTSMGLTPLEGLVMGSRSGDVDASIVNVLREKEKISIDDVDHLLNSQSGLKGVSGVGNDMRQLQQAAGEGNERAKLAIDMFCYRARKYIAAYVAALEGKVEAVIFAGGIGENSSMIRAKICDGLEWAGIRLDPVKNQERNAHDAFISAGGSSIEVLVIPTNEELMIARDTARCVNARKKVEVST